MDEKNRDEKRTNEDELPYAILSDAVDAALVDLRQLFDQFDFAGFYETLTAMPEAFVFCPCEALNWTEADPITCLVCRCRRVRRGVWEGEGGRGQGKSICCLARRERSRCSQRHREGRDAGKVLTAKIAKPRTAATDNGRP